MTVKSETRDKMISGAVDLISRRGLNATSMREVVRHTNTPRGSIKHHFPNGRLELITEAVELAGKQTTLPLQQVMKEHHVIVGLDIFIEGWKNILKTSHYQAGCPILAVAAEQYIGDDSAPNVDAETMLLTQADNIFKNWQKILMDALHKDGVNLDKAARLANLIISSIEGTVAMCRAAKSMTPLEDVQHELKLILKVAIE